MSFSDHGRPHALRTVLLAVALMALSACTVQPLYGTAPSGGPVKAAISRISVEPVSDRVAQVIRNKLIFDMTGGGLAPDPLYTMKLNVTTKQVGLGITNIESSPVYSVIVAATYTITRIDTGDVVLKSTARGDASFNRVNQVYANSRAKIDAENRAAEAAAEEIALRIAATAARGL